MRALKLGLALGAAVSSAAEPSLARTPDEPVRGVFSSASGQGPYAHLFGALALGRGLRFNNPYRLETELGDDGESLSLSASYLDFGLGASFGDPDRLRHGTVVHLSIALTGIAQEVASASYLALLPVGRDVMLLGRAGVPVVLEPDLGAGLELGLGGAWMLTGGVGVTSELVSSLFFGAATWEEDPTVIPVLSLEIGAWVEYEVLP